METRRSFMMKSAFALASVSATLRGHASAVAGSKKIPVGIQLYSFRKQAEQGFDAVIKKSAELGFAGVEFAGYGPYGDKPGDLSKLLADNNLKAFGTHNGYNLVMPDQIQKTIEFHKALGCPYIIVSWIDPKQLDSKDKCLKTAEALTRAADTAQAAGLHVGYHAHGADFKKVDGNLSAWEILFDNTPKSFIQQIDIGNCISGGGDPYAMIERYPGRSLSVHLKEHGGPAKAVFGQGQVDFKRVISLCEQFGDTTCYIIEHESDPDNAYAAAKSCLDHMVNCR